MNAGGKGNSRDNGDGGKHGNSEARWVVEWMGCGGRVGNVGELNLYSTVSTHTSTFLCTSTGGWDKRLTKSARPRLTP